MKLTALSVLLVAVAGNGVAGEVLQCMPVASSCKALPLATAKLCSSIITSGHIPIASCQKPQSTVTVTATSIPTVTSTKTIRATTTTRTVTSTSTVRGPIISLDPTTIGTVTTTTTTETSTYSSLSIVSETTTKTETDPVTLTITESSSTTTSEPFIHTFCAAEKREVSSGWGALQHEKRAEYYLPRDCSCFLTSTMLNVKEATYTTTITKPMTKTKTEITGGLVPTSTSTITKKTTVSVPGSTLVRLTSTSTSTKTVTSTKTSSTISTSTSTQVTTTTSQAKTTSTTTSTSTSTINHPCEPTNIDSILSPFTIYFFFNAALTELPTRPDDPTPCCYQCWTRKGCFAWAFEGQNGRCQLFSAPDDLPSYLCQTDQCPKGYQRLPWLPDPSDPRIWGAGYCGYDIHDGNIT